MTMKNNLIKFHIGEETVIWSEGVSMYTMRVMNGSVVVRHHHYDGVSNIHAIFNQLRVNGAVMKMMGVGKYYENFKHTSSSRPKWVGDLPPADLAIIYYGLLERRTVNRRSSVRQFYSSSSGS